MSPRRFGPEDPPEDEPPLFATRPPLSPILAAADILATGDSTYLRSYIDAAAPAPPHKGVPTSVAASESMKGRAPTDRKRVLDLISWTNGATTDEIEVALDLRHQNASARVWELAGNGGHPARIRDSGETRKTRSGRMAIVWKVSGYFSVDKPGTPADSSGGG